MAFSEAYKLVQWLEGVGRKGEKWGMEQGTWNKLGFSGKVELAGENEIGQAYRKMWDSCKIANPEAHCEVSVFDYIGYPADAVAFQCFINIPWEAFHKLLQGVVGVEQDGVFGEQTWHAMRKMTPSEIAEKILDAQREHYQATAQPEYVKGLLNRVSKVDGWLAGKVDLAAPPQEPDPADFSGGWFV